MRCLTWLWLVLLLGPGPALAQPRLVVSPPLLQLQLASPTATQAQATVDVQVLVPPGLPWQLQVLVLGPPLSAQGQNLPILPLSWQGSPGHVFQSGSLRPGGPQPCGRGQGPQHGRLQFTLTIPEQVGADHLRLKLLFLLRSL